MLSFLVLLAASSAEPPCNGSSTIAVNACFGARLRQSDAELNRYYRAALDRARRERGREAADRLIEAERSWVAYRDSECRSVFEFWRGGTIRVSMELGCRIRLTSLRAYALWRDWLTYADSTPPLLPRPDVDSLTRER